jgi:hypothetical protein
MGQVPINNFEKRYESYENKIINFQEINNNNIINWSLVENNGLWCILFYLSNRFNNIIIDFYGELIKIETEDNLIKKIKFEFDPFIKINKNIYKDLSEELNISYGDYIKYFFNNSDNKKYKDKEWILLSIQIDVTINRIEKDENGKEEDIFEDGKFFKSFILINKNNLIIEYIDLDDSQILNENDKDKIRLNISDFFRNNFLLNENHIFEKDRSTFIVRNTCTDYEILKSKINELNINYENKYCNVVSIIYLHIRLLFPNETFESIIKIMENNISINDLRQLFYEYIYYVESFCNENLNDIDFINKNINKNINNLNEKMNNIEICLNNFCKIIEPLSKKLLKSFNKLNHFDLNYINEIYNIQQKSKIEYLRKYFIEIIKFDTNVDSSLVNMNEIVKYNNNLKNQYDLLFKSLNESKINFIENVSKITKYYLIILMNAIDMTFLNDPSWKDNDIFSEMQHNLLSRFLFNYYIEFQYFSGFVPENEYNSYLQDFLKFKKYLDENNLQREDEKVDNLRKEHTFPGIIKYAEYIINYKGKDINYKEFFVFFKDETLLALKNIFIGTPNILLFNQYGRWFFLIKQILRYKIIKDNNDILIPDDYDPKDYNCEIKSYILPERIK